MNFVKMFVFEIVEINFFLCLICFYEEIWKDVNFVF